MKWMDKIITYFSLFHNISSRSLGCTQKEAQAISPSFPLQKYKTLIMLSILAQTDTQREITHSLFVPRVD